MQHPLFQFGCPIDEVRKAGDFEAAGKSVFDLDGKGKGGKQIEGLANAFLVKDVIEYPAAGVLPLWLLS